MQNRESSTEISWRNEHTLRLSPSLLGWQYITYAALDLYCLLRNKVKGKESLSVANTS